MTIMVRLENEPRTGVHGCTLIVGEYFCGDVASKNVIGDAFQVKEEVDMREKTEVWCQDRG